MSFTGIATAVLGSLRGGEGLRFVGDLIGTLRIW